MRDDAVLRRALPLDRGLARATSVSHTVHTVMMFRKVSPINLLRTTIGISKITKFGIQVTSDAYISLLQYSLA